MSEVKRAPANNLPDFGTTNYTGVHLEVNNMGTWEPFQLFFFDWMLDKEQNYWIRTLEDLQGWEVLGKIRISRNSDTILWATQDMLRVKN